MKRLTVALLAFSIVPFALGCGQQQGQQGQPGDTDVEMEREYGGTDTTGNGGMEQGQDTTDSDIMMEDTAGTDTMKSGNQKGDMGMEEESGGM